MSHGEAPSGGKSNPVGLAIATTIGTLALVVGIILLAKFAVGTHSPGTDSKVMTAEETAKRIAPVAKLVVDPSGSALVAVAATPVAAVAAPAAPTKVDGKATYLAACTACHGAGIAGAPKTGDKAGWAARVKTGAPALYASALKGKGAMPAKGGQTNLSDEAVKAAVDYMLAQVK